MALPLTLQADSPLQYAVHRPQQLEDELSPIRLPRRRHRKERGRTDPFPFDPVTRWLLRIVIALPYAGIAALLTLSGQNVATGNALLLERVDAVDLGALNVAGLLELYPPISTGLAVLIPGGLLGMGLVGALVAGVVVQQMIEICVQRELPRATAVLLVIALAANPLFAYLAVSNLGVFLGLSFFGLGLTHVVRFILWGSTRSGFIAGLLFMGAALCDGGAIFYVLSIALTAPFLRWSRGDYRGARRASIYVLLFPLASAFILLVALELLFRVNPFGGVGELMVGTPARTQIFLFTALPSIDGLLLVAPVIGAWLIGLAVRRPGAIAASSLVFISVMIGFVLGLIPTAAAGSTFMLMLLLAIALIPTSGRRYIRWVVPTVAVGQIAVAWATALNRDLLMAWMGAILEGASRLVS
jgi:hypothetical protein